MKLSLKNLILSNYNLKIVSLIFGYFIWYMYNQSTIAVCTLNVPVCFYNMKNTLEAPEKVTITLQAKRADLYHCDFKTLAVHINGQELKEGINKIPVNEQYLFLPQSIKVVHCIPQPIEIKL